MTDQRLAGSSKEKSTGMVFGPQLPTAGVACMVEEFEQRFDRYGTGLTKSKDVGNVRVVVE